MNKCDCRCPDHEDTNIIIDDKEWIYAMAFCPKCDNFHDLGNINKCDFCKKEEVK